MNVNELFESAFKKFQSNNLREAEEICYRLLRMDYKNVNALLMLGVINTHFKKYDTALSYTVAALELDPYLLGGYYNIGTILLQKGNMDEALKWFRQVIDIDPNHAESHTNVGFVLLQKGDVEGAIKHFEKVIELRKDSGEAYYNLANAYHEKKDYSNALKNYHLAIGLDPDLVDGYYNLGSIYTEIGEKDKAIAYLTKSIALESNKAVSYFLLGNVFVSKGNMDEAIMNYEKAISLKPDYFDAYFNLGYAYGMKKMFDEAVQSYQKALEIKPDFIDAYINLAVTLRDIGKSEEAKRYFDILIEKDYDVFAGEVGKCFSNLLIIYPDERSIYSARQAYYEGLRKLHNKICNMNLKEIELDSFISCSNMTFYLPYQQMNDRDLQVVYGEIVTKVMHAKYPQYSKPIQMMEVREGERIRVGIASAFFYHHSNWKIPIRGWVENINRDKFELFGYYTGKKDDEQTEVARRSFDHFVEGVDSFERLCERIRSDNLHVLIYPEIGMDAVILKLASLRLAPIQCTSWGHPETSGLKTIDYFLSSELMEPEDADEHYTERLVRLPNLSIYYTPIDIEPEPITRESIGINEDSVIYFCSQSLFKYLPQYDRVFTDIARKVNNCVFLFISSQVSKYVEEEFRDRIYKQFNLCGIKPESHVIILPRLSGPLYHAINKISDVFLDSIGWSGCNSTFEALQYNLPIVTIPGRLMRGRHTYAILKMMGLEETIAKSIEDYIDIAVKLGKDKGFRKIISEKIASNKNKVYRDNECIEGLEKFFEDVVYSYSKKVL